VHHAEAVLAEFFRVIDFNDIELWWLMLLEPCRDCLIDMIDAKAEVIAYYEEHKAKWNTSEYLKLKHQIAWAGTPKYLKEIIQP